MANNFIDSVPVDFDVSGGDVDWNYPYRQDFDSVLQGLEIGFSNLNDNVNDLSADVNDNVVQPINSLISTTVMEYFDRVVANGGYRYYYAYNNGSASYLYLFNQYSKSGSRYSVPSYHELYYHRPSSYGDYQINHSNGSNYSFSLGSDIAYTNVDPDYAVLGYGSGTRTNWYLCIIIVLLMVINTVLWRFLRKGK